MKNAPFIVKAFPTLAVIAALFWLALYERQHPHITQVVCIGDSITYGSSGLPKGSWSRYGFTVERSYEYYMQNKLGQRWQVVNKGICANTTWDLIGRFENDVIRPRPAYVIILIGTNDVAFNVPAQQTQSNIDTLVNQAMANRITPIICTLLPDRRNGESGKQARAALNTFLREYAIRKGLLLLDFNKVMGDPQNPHSMPAKYTGDYTHPINAGYQVMGEYAAARLLEYKRQRDLSTPPF